MPRITLEEMRQSKGIGASEVAAVCHLDPWRTARELFEMKTGRREKDERTAAMEFGIDMEQRGMDCYLRMNGLDPMEQQVGVVHAELDFLRGFADGWNGTRGVDVKTPSGTQLFEEAGFYEEFEGGVVPNHYLCQCAAYMEMFGVKEWDFFVYMAEADTGVTLTARWDEMWDPQRSLGEFWKGTAVPLLREFWRRMVDDEWNDSPDFVPPDTEKWVAACQTRQEVMRSIKELEKVKDATDAEIKQMMGFQSSLTLGGFRSEWQPRKGSLIAGITCEDAETFEKILKTVEPLSSIEGVKDVGNVGRKPSSAFIVKSLTPKNVSKFQVKEESGSPAFTGGGL